MRHSFWAATLLILLFSCGTSDQKTETSADLSLSLELADSLDLDFLGSPVLASCNPEGTRLAFFDYPSKKIIVSDGSGEILDTLSKQGDTPDAYGFMIDLPVIYGKDKLIQVGMNGIFIYTQKGEMLKKIKHPEDMGRAVFASRTGKTSKIIELNGSPYLLMNSVRTRGTFAGAQEFYDTYKALELINLETGEAQDFGPFEEGSLFLNGKGFIQSDYFPSYAENKSKLYLSHGGEPKLWIYDFSPSMTSLDTALSLDIPGLFPIEGVERQELSEGSYSFHGGTAAIRNIFIQNGLILISYFPGMDPKLMEEANKLWSEGKEKESQAIYEKLNRETPPGIIVFDETSLEFLGRLSYPEKANTGGLLADDKFIYFQKKPDPDVEEDFLRVYKYKLTQE
ncbi:hypothetical protein [Algoriphagus zhangzhouensis]|uniref:6-bladed beta-propeller protein n=1 Tax=Algoriphagus zhangzhouensis TaxID=1073327 RepID=A0A1M7ZF11_9BACT|nr:hypothetical protein [Algoriphagus zhangzhouensis]TDY46162.1 hypothetical protein A8938_2773 [Algoriphagus zhangzhouensis]SHO63463.1 hypothetical protein SAMN04488108_2770 [Algoriphagus zhangzhouensis]